MDASAARAASSSGPRAGGWWEEAHSGKQRQDIERAPVIVDGEPPQLHQPPALTRPRRPTVHHPESSTAKTSTPLLEEQRSASLAHSDGRALDDAPRLDLDVQKHAGHDGADRQRVRRPRDHVRLSCQHAAASDNRPAGGFSRAPPPLGGFRGGQKNNSSRREKASRRRCLSFR